MKKFFNMMFVACGLLAFTACDDDVENPYASQTSIVVVSANLDFSPSESEGTIHFTSTGGTVTATSPVSWCKPRVSGDSVIVSVEQNNGAAGRSTVVVLQSGSESMQVALTQRGIVLDTESDIISGRDAGGRFVTGVTSNLDVEFVSAPDWVTATVTNDSVVVEMTENTTGHLRSGAVWLKSGDVLDSVRIVQADFDTDIAGSYNLYYRPTLTGELTFLPVTLTEDALEVTAFNLSVPMTFDMETMQMTLQSGTYIGRSGSNYLYLVFGADEGLYWTQYFTTFQMSASFAYDDAEGTRAVFGGELDYGDNFVPGNMDTFFFWQFSTDEMSTETDLGALLTFYFPYLQREPSAPTSYVVR